MEIDNEVNKFITSEQIVKRNPSAYELIKIVFYITYMMNLQDLLIYLNYLFLVNKGGYYEKTF